MRTFSTASLLLISMAAVANHRGTVAAPQRWRFNPLPERQEDMPQPTPTPPGGTMFNFPGFQFPQMVIPGFQVPGFSVPSMGFVPGGMNWTMITFQMPSFNFNFSMPARRTTWKHVKALPGPDGSTPLLWIVRQHFRIARVTHMVPYNVSTTETHIGLCSQYQKKGLYRFYVGNQLHVMIFKAELIEVIGNRREELIRERRTVHAVFTNDDEFREKRRLTFIDILLHHSLDFDALLTDEAIREEVDTFMFEGHDTTTMAVAWCLYLIGLHRQVQTKVQEELDDVLREQPDRNITPEDMKKLKYMDCVIKESQRLCPAVPFIGRTATEELKLGKVRSIMLTLRVFGVLIGKFCNLIGCQVITERFIVLRCVRQAAHARRRRGHTIPKGTNIGLILYVLHRNPDVFPRPEEFDPDRFLPENSATRHPFAFVPFSAGSRNCIGQKFAWMDIKIILGHVLRSFSLQSADPRDKLLMTVDVVLRTANGLKIKFIPRVS
ncbi:hypothetical protein HPB47_025766 [Ixodes persulcatus]|uniref:Uncharacterized protein n=1 Tax=Ixodes persulcatus TaxID=34615 RepID=A0AC60Q2E3_IXOPE|nr:hypothetical protein HPB47_025766 [Ixodes persulcatus]